MVEPMFDLDGDHSDLYDCESVATHVADSCPSFLGALPCEIIALVAVYVAHSDVAALKSLLTVIPHVHRVVATTPVRLPWSPKHTTVPLWKMARLADAFGVRGTVDVADSARRCLILAYVDWVTGDVPDGAPTAAMAAASLLSVAETTRDLDCLRRLLLGPTGKCTGQTFAVETALDGLGETAPTSDARPVRIIHRLDSTVLCRMAKAHGRTNANARGTSLGGHIVRRWMDDAIDLAAKRRSPGAFVVAPEAMPRFSDLFAIDGARVAIPNNNEMYLAGRLRPLW